MPYFPVPDDAASFFFGVFIDKLYGNDKDKVEIRLA